MVLRTNKIESNQKPRFSARLRYPVTFPLSNDKIVMKCWHEGTFMSPDVFIANAPENPFIDGWFNVNFLQSTGGNLPFTWINMYGIPQDERPGFFDKMISGSPKYIEGTDYMGRVLLSMNLIAHDKPEKGNQYLSGTVEPETQAYQLRVDLIEARLTDVGDIIEVDARFGVAKEDDTLKVVREFHLGNR